jgi:hypothetical protein
VADTSLDSPPEEHWVGDGKKSIIQDREDSNPIARVLVAPQHLLLRNPNVHAGFGQLRMVEGG